MTRRNVDDIVLTVLDNVTENLYKMLIHGREANVSNKQNTPYSERLLSKGILKFNDDDDNNMFSGDIKGNPRPSDIQLQETDQHIERSTQCFRFTSNIHGSKNNRNRFKVSDSLNSYGKVSLL